MRKRWSITTWAGIGWALAVRGRRPLPLVGGTIRGNRQPITHRGQGLVEFALALPVLLTLIFGCIEFGMAITTDIVLTNATRTAARWAIVHPTAWSSETTAPSNTIEGQLQQAQGVDTIPNDDSHIQITYQVATAGDPTTCGSYRVSSGFVAQNGYSQATCVVPGTLIAVQATDQYQFMDGLFTSLFPSGLTLSTSTTMLEEQ